MALNHLNIRVAALVTVATTLFFWKAHGYIVKTKDSEFDAIWEPTIKQGTKLANKYYSLILIGISILKLYALIGYIVKLGISRKKSPFKKRTPFDGPMYDFKY